MTNTERFKKLIDRMRADWERYNKINTNPNTEDEKTIVEICRRFWGESFSSGDGYNIKTEIDNNDLYERDLDELEKILDRMEWNGTVIDQEYNRWLRSVQDSELVAELKGMDEETIEDAFYRNLAFGTGGLRGTIGAGTNRMNVYIVAKASQGLAEYICSVGAENVASGLVPESAKASVVIGYDSRNKSDVFAKVAAEVFAANGIKVYLWPELNPVPTVSFAVRYLGAFAGVMITASHNPSKYNGYKVYGSDGCQITTEAAAEILEKINALDIFGDVKRVDFESALADGKIEYIKPEVLTAFIEEVKGQSVLFDDDIDKNVSIVYSPLNGTGLIPVTRALSESGFSNITVVEEQRYPDGNFPTCPYPNPEIREAMELGLEYCHKTGADLLLATDPDADRCGIAVRNDSGEYVLLSGNEVGLLLLDYVCAQRVKHGKMPSHPVFVKTIVTMDLAEKIASHYGVETINVLTGFKFIGEVIGRMEAEGRADDYICGFEESYGYLTGTYVRDKDAVNAAFMICEMFAFYKTRGVSLIEKLDEIYFTYGYCLNTLHSYEFPGSSGMTKMQAIMADFHKGLDTIGGKKVVRTEDYNVGLNGLPKSDVLKFFFEDEKAGGGAMPEAEVESAADLVSVTGSVVVRPSGTEPKLKVYISVTAENKVVAEELEKKMAEEIGKKFG